MLLVGGIGCLELCLYGVRELVWHKYERKAWINLWAGAGHQAGEVPAARWVRPQPRVRGVQVPLQGHQRQAGGRLPQQLRGVRLQVILSVLGPHLRLRMDFVLHNFFFSAGHSMRTKIPSWHSGSGKLASISCCSCPQWDNFYSIEHSHWSISIQTLRCHWLPR